MPQSAQPGRSSSAGAFPSFMVHKSSHREKGSVSQGRSRKRANASLARAMGSEGGPPRDRFVRSVIVVALGVRSSRKQILADPPTVRAIGERKSDVFWLEPMLIHIGSKIEPGFLTAFGPRVISDFIAETAERYRVEHGYLPCLGWCSHTRMSWKHRVKPSATALPGYRGAVSWSARPRLPARDVARGPFVDAVFCLLPAPDYL
jgi:hypothetical protein